MPYPDRFYPVVDTLDWVRRLAGLGVGTLQLRAKDLNDGEALQLVSDALEIVKGTPTRLVINDYWRAAIVAGAEHVHLGQEDLAEADVGEIRKAGLTLGLSTIFVSLNHMDGHEMVKFMNWAQGILTLQPSAAGYVADVNPIFKAHLLLGMTLFLIFPFTRLVHIWSAPVWYLFRPGYQVVRTRFTGRRAVRQPAE